MAYAGEYVYRFRVEDAFTGAMRQFSDAKRVHQVEMGEMTVTYGRVAEAQEALSRRILRFSGIAIQASILSFVFNLTQRRLAHAHERVRTALEAYNRALLKYGAGSEEAQRASRRLQLAKEDLSRAYWEANFQTFIAIVQLGMLAVRAYEAISGLAGLKIATAASAFADVIHNKILTVKVSLMSALKYGIFAAIGAIATYTALTLMMSQTTAEAERRLSSLRETAGRPASTGLIESFEYLTQRIQDTQLALQGLRMFAARWEAGIRIGGATIQITGLNIRDLEAALNEYTERILAEARRAGL